MERKQEILDFIKSKKLMALSTINEEGRPEAAVVGFSETDEFQLIFGTSNKSRKYRNLQDNSNVAVVIGWDWPQTVQYEGVARELTGTEAEKYSEIYYAKSPKARPHHEHEDQRYFLIEPKWLRLTDLSATPWDIVELKF